MAFFSRKKPLVGLDIGSSSVKAVELVRTRNGYEITGFGYAPLAPDAVSGGTIANRTVVADAVRSAFGKAPFKARKVATGVAGNSVIVKRVVLPVDTPEEVAGSIEFDADRYIPFDISDVNLDHHVIGHSDRDGGGLEVLIVAAKKDQVESSTEVVSMAGRVPHVVDLDAFALQNAFEANYSPGPDDTVALINIGASLTNINILKGGMPMFIRDVAVGGDQYTDILKKELQLSEDEAEDLKRGKQVGMYDSEMVAPLLNSITDMLTMEVQKTFDFFKQNFPSESISSIYLAGGTSRSPGMTGKIQGAFGVDVQILDPLKSVSVNPSLGSEVREHGPALAVALGLAMRGFDQ
jgi:type IV pilus assembly protein PilM